MRIDQAGVKYEISVELSKYIEKKVKRMSRFIPRKDRAVADARVSVEKVDRPSGDEYEVNILLDLPGRQIAAKEEAGNPFAAMDIVDEKITRQIKKYKEKKLLPKIFRRK